jgi:hypothetical protein
MKSQTSLEICLKTLPIIFSLTFTALAMSGCEDSRAASTNTEVNNATSTPQTSAAEITKLKEHLAHLSGLVPDQAAVMSHLGYHFTNLWFAIQQENWPLADFYLAECRSNLKWAVRVKPIRQTTKGERVDVASIAAALDNTEFTELQQSISHKDKNKTIEIYHNTIKVCYSCHTASEKPYLRVQLPSSPEVRIINFDAKAAPPE